MDWNGAIGRNREALRRILITLSGMAGMAVGADGVIRAGGGEGILRRATQNALLRLIRPAEAAVRRLVMILAQTMPLPPEPSSRMPAPVKAAEQGVRSLVTTRAGVRCRLVWKPGARFPTITPLPPHSARARSGFRMLDPLQRPFRENRKYVPAHSCPRLVFLTDDAVLRPLPPRPSPDDYLDATRIALRLAALGQALDDLPARARGFARWQARNAKLRSQGLARRASSMKPGLPPGMPRHGARAARHQVHDVLREVHGLAQDSLQRRPAPS